MEDLGYIMGHYFSFKKIVFLPLSLLLSLPLSSSPLLSPFSSSSSPLPSALPPFFSRENGKLRDSKRYPDLKKFARKTPANYRGIFELFVINLRHFFPHHFIVLYFSPPGFYNPEKII